MHGAVGVGVLRFHPFSLLSFKFALGCLDLGLHLVGSFLQPFLINFAIVHYLVLEGFLDVLLLLASDLSAAEVPRLRIVVLEKLYFFFACLPTLQTSSQVAWPHVHELLALLVPSLPVAFTKKSRASSTMFLVFTFRLADRDQVSRNPLVRAKVALSVVSFCTCFADFPPLTLILFEDCASSKTSSRSTVHPLHGVSFVLLKPRSFDLLVALGSHFPPVQ